ncbi:HTH_Tnp_Tc3_2 domain-containing protein [Trichonephila clavipes]|nr:HTH_Tnp_Tc3_2 domain-containing protein [Trichonephila clavipes]
MREKGGDCLVPVPYYMVDALKHPNLAPRVSGESPQTCVAWRCPDGMQHLFCWPILAVSDQSLASNGPVNNSKYLNLVFGHFEATHSKGFHSSPTKYTVEPSWPLVLASEKQVGRIDVSAATSVGATRCWQQWITEGRVYHRGGSGRPRNTNDREDRAIRRVATSAPTTSLASIQRHLPPSRHPVPSRETIRRRLTEVGFEEPTSAKTLTPHHRQCRLDFCRPRATWSVTDWRRVIFNDESRFYTCLEAHRPAVRSGIYCRAA